MHPSGGTCLHRQEARSGNSVGTRREQVAWVLRAVESGWILL
jgi:hypothetical protein